MKRLHVSLCLTVWAGVFASCGDCAERVAPPETEEPVREEVVAVLPLQQPESLLLDDRRVLLSGEVDDSNRYLAAVEVNVFSGERKVMICSGAALSRRVVLTAGHCVCPLRQAVPGAEQGQEISDASSCATSVDAALMHYDPPSKDNGRVEGARRPFSPGTVRPHPELKVVVDGERHVKESHADLALIVLDEPLEVAGLPLSNEEVRVGDKVVIVGYGYDETVDWFGSERRFSMNTVTRLGTPGDERVLIRQPGGHRYRQDSGGPCLRQGQHGPELVGISSRWLGEGAACTSTYGYRRWLRDEVRRAEAVARPRKEPR
ncbi:trypsin-like serine protease [Hyalangium gracile]|uniref:trypsin-like serine protease n=1 Tax=Hyalangium gracile TaxID=394092 RepID=UPI001CCD0877|nr:trypsin-like serine protease [Hyalangium gracile]